MWDDKVWDHVDAAVQRFQDACRSETSVELARFVPAADEATRRAVLTQLIILDQERRWRLGERPRLEEYVDRYGEIQCDPDILAELAEAEYRIRVAFDDTTTEDGLAQGGSSTIGSEPRVSARLPDNFGLQKDLDRYEVREVLGHGGMGEVYRAYDTKLHREVAIKTPRYDPALDPEIAMRFIREIRATAALRHPNICPVYDADMSNGHYFIIMALIEGTDLAALLNSGAMDPARAVQLTAKVAHALEVAHQAGIVHRDIKPGNILLDETGEPLLTDFGLCRQIHGDSGAMSGSTLLGTPAYMAPEQAAVQPADRSSDIYSLGVVLYQMLTGVLPFTGTPPEVLSQLASDAPPGVREHRSDLDPALEAICMRAMSRNPADRYDSAGDFAASLDAYSALLGRPTHGPRPIRVFMAAAVGLASITLALWGWQYLSIDTQPPIPPPIDKRIARLYQQINNLSGIEPLVEEVRQLENDALKFQFDDRSTLATVQRLLARLMPFAMTEQEHEMRKKAVAAAKSLGFTDNVTKAYLPARLFAEMLDMRLTILKNKLDSSDSREESLSNAAHSRVPDEIAARIADSQLVLSDLAGVEEEIITVWTMATDYYDAGQSLFSPTKEQRVRCHSLVSLARLRVFPLTDEEKAVANDAEKAGWNTSFLSDPIGVYVSVRKLA